MSINSINIIIYNPFNVDWAETRRKKIIYGGACPLPNEHRSNHAHGQCFMEGGAYQCQLVKDGLALIGWEGEHQDVMISIIQRFIDSKF